MAIGDASPTITDDSKTRGAVSAILEQIRTEFAGKTSLPIRATRIRYANDWTGDASVYIRIVFADGDLDFKEFKRVSDAIAAQFREREITLFPYVTPVLESELAALDAPEH